MGVFHLTIQNEGCYRLITVNEDRGHGNNSREVFQLLRKSLASFSSVALCQLMLRM